MTPEERLAKVETLLPEMRADLAELRRDVGDLVKVAQMGKGALWFVLKAGAFLIGTAGFAKLLWDTFGGKHP